MQETQVWFLGREDRLEKEMATHSSILAWRVPWKEPGRVQSMEVQRVRQKWLKQQQILCMISLLLFLYFFWRWGGLYFRLVVIFRLITSMRPLGLCPHLGFCYFICQLWVPSLDADLFSLWESVSSPCFPQALPTPTAQSLSAHTRFTHIFSTLFPIFVL